jgi:Skp family chaperone for outer membrane proteins
MKRASLLIVTMLLLTAVVFAQDPTKPITPATPASQTAAPKTTPAAPAGPPPTAGIAVLDFTRALTGTGEGTKATNKLNVEFQARQKKLQDKNQEGAAAQTELQTKATVISEARKAELSKKIDQVSTELTRMNDDFQREMSELQQQFLGPVADMVKKAANDYAVEKGYAVVLDISSDSSNIVYKNDSVDITDAVILKVDEMAPKAPAPAARPSGAAPAPNPATPRGGTTAPTGGRAPATPPTTPPKPNPSF